MKKLQCSLGLVLVILSCFSCSRHDELNIRYRMERAFFRAEKLRQILTVNPKAARSEDYAKVVDAYSKVIKMVPPSVIDTAEKRQVDIIAGASQLRIADVYLLQNKLPQAILELEKVTKLYSGNPDQSSQAILMTAQIHQQMGNRDKAIESFHLLLDPDKYPPVVARENPNLDLLAVPLNLILNSKDKKEAKLEFENAKSYYGKLIRDYPYSPLASAAKIDLAKTYQILGDWKQAIKLLETVKDSSGSVPPSIYMEIGDIYFLQGNDIDSARAVFERVVLAYPTNPASAQALLRIGDIYYQRKNYQKSREVLSRISIQFPKRGQIIAQAQYLIAQSYEKQGQWDRAVNEFESITTNFPTTVQALEVPLHIATYYLQQGNPKLAQTFYDKAVSQYQKLLEKYPKTQLELMALKYTARCYTLQSKWKEGIETLDKIIDKYPQTSDAYEALRAQATIFEQKLNQKNKAKEVYSEILTRFPNNPSASEIKKRIEAL